METVLNIFCENCGEKLDSKKAKWLELSETDGNYYVKIPQNHISQGSFSFGTACAAKELRKTISSIKQHNLR